jgi:hypothetical protein
MSTIPASQLVNVTPNVLAAGGSAVDLNGLLLSANTRVPVGTVSSFANAAAVNSFFGGTSYEALWAAIYFAGFDGSNKKPGALLVAQYPTAAVSAYLRGGNISAMTLAELQALSGTLSVTIDGVLKTASINLSAATSFSNAAEIIAAALGIEGTQAATITGSIAGTTLTVTALGSGGLSAGDVLSGTGVTAATYIVGALTGTGGAGTYTVSPSQTAISQAITAYSPAVQYDSVSGAFTVSGSAGSTSTITFASGALGTSLLLTSATGAVLSQGAAAATPSAFMTTLIASVRNWATFTTAFNPDNSGNTNKLAFAAWASGQNQQYAYVPWDTDASPTTTVPASSSLGQQLIAAGDSGSFPIWEPSDLMHQAFVMGIAASIDFSQTNGRTDFMFRTQAGLVPGVTDLTTSANLLSNGYNYYGAYAEAGPQFNILAKGSVSGAFAWMDTYCNQIWLNSSFQSALLALLLGSKSIPYNAAGRASIEQALKSTIDQALNFGAIRVGVTLSSSQIAAVNAAAKANIAPTITQQGWYLQVLDASPTVRAARGSPPCTFWYADGGSVQQINLTSVVIQ